MTAARAKNLREKILESAVRLLHEKGLKALAQPQVARKAGIPQGHLTYYFPKRSDLLLAVAELAVDRVAETLREARSRAGTALGPGMLKLVQSLVKDRERSRMLLGLVVEADESPELRARLAERIGSVRALAAQALGREPDDPDAWLFVAALWGIGLQHFLLEGRRTDAETDALIRRLAEWAAASATAPRVSKPRG